MTGYRPPNPAPRLRVTDDLVAHAASRLTDRDRWLLAILAEHQLLTSRHIELLAFTGARQTRARLALLWQLHVLDRLRPHRGTTPAPTHYTVGHAGARLLAAQAGLTTAATGWRPDRLAAWATSPRLAHLTGVNTVFVALAYASRPRPPGHGLTTWWSERRCAALWGTHARPDGYGTWTTAEGTRLDFFLEYDRGTEPLGRLAGKLAGYAALATASGITSPVLIWLPTPAREAHLRARLAATPATAAVPVATASPHPLLAGPADLAAAGPAWLPLHTQARTTLDGLAATHGTHAFDTTAPAAADAPTPRAPSPGGRTRP